MQRTRISRNRTETEANLLNASDVAAGARVVAAGGVIAYPTEACYGIGCDPLNEYALKRVIRLKHRPKGMGLILVAYSIDQLLPFIKLPDKSILDEPLSSWPGPYTWIFPANPSLPMALRSINNSVAVRVTAHVIASRICAIAGSALVSTSANRHGHLPLRDHRKVTHALGPALDFVVRGRLGSSKKPTQIRDAMSGKLIRAA